MINKLEHLPPKKKNKKTLVICDPKVQVNRLSKVNEISKNTLDFREEKFNYFIQSKTNKSIKNK